MSKLINFCSPWNPQKTKGFLMISGGIEVDWFAQIRFIIKANFGDNPLPKLSPITVAAFHLQSYLNFITVRSQKTRSFAAVPNVHPLFLFCACAKGISPYYDGVITWWKFIQTRRYSLVHKIRSRLQKLFHLGKL